MENEYIPGRMMRTALRLLLAILLCAAPPFVFGQSADLVRSYKDFESAKSAHKVADALKYGNEAVRLTEQSGDKQQLGELLRSLGDYAAQENKDSEAVGYYERALALEQDRLGAANPELVPLLTDMANVQLKGQHYSEAEPLLNRIVGIERAAYGEHHPNVLATLGRLRDLYIATHDSEAVARVEAQMRPPVANDRALPAPGTLKNRRYKQDHGFATVRVFYGTNRAATGALKAAEFYGGARGDLNYGYLDVTIPQTHVEADLETQPRWVEYTLGASEAEMRTHYVLLDKVVQLPKDQFVQQLRAQIGAAPSKDVFIFVHGFNNTFEDAARRVAQLAYDLDFDGTPMLYSWPSQGSTTAYSVDEASVQISGRRMADFLETVVAQSGAQHVHLIAHSMGNRALIEAMQTYLAKRAPENRQHIFGQVVFTAPDVDRDYFTDAVVELNAAAQRTTLYASDTDYAIRTSQFFHGAPRAGTAGDVIVKLAGLDSIDMSAVPADSLGHSYFAANAGALYDMFRLLWRGDPPPKRCGMTNPKSGIGSSVWLFDAQHCKGDDILEAGVMLKRFGDLALAHVQANIAGLTDPTQQQQKQQWQLILTRLQALQTTVGLPIGVVAQ
jgi:esterase/lipase superfamily enzyme